MRNFLATPKIRREKSSGNTDQGCTILISPGRFTSRGRTIATTRTRGRAPKTRCSRGKEKKSSLQETQEEKKGRIAFLARKERNSGEKKAGDDFNLEERKEKKIVKRDLLEGT